MKTRVHALAVVALLGMLLTAACALHVQAPKSASAKVPTLADISTLEPGAKVGTVADTSAAQPPICQAIASCAALNAEQIMLQCVKKVPYTNVLVPKGTTFDVVDRSGEFTCIDSGTVVNGKQVLTCHGKELYSFQLKLTNASCSGSLVTGTGQCQEGYGYYAAQQCCAPAGGDAAGSTTVSIDLGGCP